MAFARGAITMRHVDPQQNRSYSGISCCAIGPELMPKPDVDRTRESLPQAQNVLADEFADWLQSHFAQIDKDKNGSVTKSEVQVAMQNPRLATGRGAIYLSAAHDQVDVWKKAFEQQDGGKIGEGFSLNGIRNYRQARSNPDLLKNNADQLKVLSLTSSFTRVDQDLNGRIDSSELSTALKREGWTTGQREMLQATVRNFDRIKSNSDGISRDDISNFPDAKAKAVVWLENSANYFERRLNEVRANPNQLLSQGLNNGCFFLAPLLEMQMRDPNSLKRMIKNNPDGTRTVTFAGDRKNPITVNAPTEAELITYANNRDAATIEKAFGIHWYRKEKAEAEKEKRELPTKWPEPAERLQFGQAPYAMKLLTGKETERKDPAQLSEDELKRYLESIHAEGKLFTVGSRDTHENTKWGLTPKHEYVASYDPKTATITLTNPLWPGSGTLEPSNLDFTALDGKNDRTFTITIPILRDRFFEIVTTKSRAPK